VIALSMHGNLFVGYYVTFFFSADLRPEPAIITTPTTQCESFYFAGVNLTPAKISGSSLG
jgi:hypothetical protein